MTETPDEPPPFRKGEHLVPRHLRKGPAKDDLPDRWPPDDDDEDTTKPLYQDET